MSTSTSGGASKPKGFYPAPPGITPNFVNPATLQGNNIALHTVMLFFVTLCVVIRIYTRAFITRQLGVDDYFCIFAYGLALIYSSLLLACGHYYLGHHIWDIPKNDFLYGSKLEVMAEFMYLILSAAIKLSCLTIYLRLFGPNKVSRWLCYGGIAFIIGGYFSFLMASVFDCTPVAKHWNPLLKGHCLPSGTLAYGSGALNVLTDIYVVFLPTRAIWRLQMKLWRKIKIIGVFSLGLVVCALSITRLAKTPLVFKQKDATWVLFGFSVYSVLELYIGLICACSLAFPSFLDRYGPGFNKKVRSYIGLLYPSSMRSHTQSQRTGSSSTDKVVNEHHELPTNGVTTQHPQCTVTRNSYARLDEEAGGIRVPDRATQNYVQYG